jgi:hypothetical protein
MKSLIFCLFFAPIYAQYPAANWDDEMIEVVSPNKSGVLMSFQSIYDDKWDQLSQALFWKEVMKLHPDSVIINVASTRLILTRLSAKKWNQKSELDKNFIKDSLRQKFGILADQRLMVTTGKSHFYRFDDVYESLTKGVLAFEKYEVDPWYAQAILLIESPGQLVKSNVGAYGAFQLMPGVARAQGLKVTKTIDERKDFDRSAYAAASLIRKTCIPSAKSILSCNNISFNENDLWFRLFVMHIYHAGAGNVRAVFDKINPVMGGQQLITEMWQTQAGKFGNASQNYSQVVLASQMILNEMVGNNCEKLFSCGGN